MNDCTAKRFVEFMTYIWDGAPREIYDAFHDAQATARHHFGPVKVEDGVDNDDKPTTRLVFKDDSWALVYDDGSGIPDWYIGLDADIALGPGSPADEAYENIIINTAKLMKEYNRFNAGGLINETLEMARHHAESAVVYTDGHVEW